MDTNTKPKLIVPNVSINGLQTLPVVLRALSASQARGPILTAVLATPPGRVADLGHLTGLRAQAAGFHAQYPEEATAAFDEAVARISGYLSETDLSGYPAWACFASADSRFFYATPLPATVNDRIEWSRQPSLEPLTRALAEQERSVLALVDAQQTRIFSFALGAIERVVTVDDDTHDAHRNRQADPRTQPGSTDELRHHIRHTADELIEELRAHPFDRLYLAGTDAAAPLLEHNLPPALAHRLAGRVEIACQASHEEVRGAFNTLAAQTKRRDQEAEVRSLLAARSEHLAVAGIAEVLEAFNDQRIERLILGDDFDLTGGRCPNCGRILAGNEPCPFCRRAAVPVADFREELLSSAFGAGASVEFIERAADAAFVPFDHVAAWTFPPRAES